MPAGKKEAKLRVSHRLIIANPGKPNLGAA
jgi:hypothetical protein